MGLLERVAALVRANLNDLVDRAEDPAKMLKQVVLDMQNQLLQVKTQVAMAAADLHLLERKREDHDRQQTDALRQAELALGKGREDLARAAAGQALHHQELAASFAQQVEDQRAQVERLKSALARLTEKLAEARAKSEVLIARQRRARAVTRAASAQDGGDPTGVFDRMKDRVQRDEAMGQALTELAAEEPAEELAALEREDRIASLLDDIRARRGA